MTYHALAILLLSLLSVTAMQAGAAPLMCPEFPDGVTTVSRDVRSEVQGGVRTLAKVLAGDLAVRTEVTAKALFAKFPNADRLLLVQMMAATYCRLLVESKLDERERLERWEAFQAKVLEFSVPIKPAAPPAGGRVLRDQVGFSYMRLFGAYQAAFFLVGRSPSANHTIDSIAGGKGVTAFFERWEYRDALPLITEPWREVVGDQGDRIGVTADRLLGCASRKDSVGPYFQEYRTDPQAPAKIAKYIEQALAVGEKVSETPDTGGELLYYLSSKYGKQQAKVLLGAIQRTSRSIGFLVLYIENLSGDPIFDLRVTYSLARRSASIPECAQTNQQASETQVETRTLPHLKSGAKLMMLLSVYEADANGIPIAFLSSVVTPLRVAVRSRGSSRATQLEVRPPRLEAAARTYLPFGWIGQ